MEHISRPGEPRPASPCGAPLRIHIHLVNDGGPILVGPAQVVDRFPVLIDAPFYSAQLAEGKLHILAAAQRVDHRLRNRVHDLDGLPATETRFAKFRHEMGSADLPLLLLNLRAHPLSIITVQAGGPDPRLFTVSLSTAATGAPKGNSTGSFRASAKVDR